MVYSGTNPPCVHENAFSVFKYYASINRHDCRVLSWEWHRRPKGQMGLSFFAFVDILTRYLGMQERPWWRLSYHCGIPGFLYEFCAGWKAVHRVQSLTSYGMIRFLFVTHSILPRTQWLWRLFGNAAYSFVFKLREHVC